MNENNNDMLNHLNNIIFKIDLMVENNNYELKYDFDVIEHVKQAIMEFKDTLQNNIIQINLKTVKEISEIIYDLNSANLFSDFTDSISNEYYAFEFLLQKN